MYAEKRVSPRIMWKSNEKKHKASVMDMSSGQYPICCEKFLKHSEETDAFCWDPF